VPLSRVDSLTGKYGVFCTFAERTHRKHPNPEHQKSSYVNYRMAAFFISLSLKDFKTHKP